MRNWEIDKTIFIAANVTMERVINSLQDQKSGITDKVKDLGKSVLGDPKNDAKWQEAQALVVNDKGESLETVIAGELEDFLGKL